MGWIFILGALLSFARPTFAQQVSVLVSSKNIIQNEYGAVLSISNGAVVQFMLVNGGILPPDVDGQPHPSNTVVFTSRIGNGLVPDASADGRLNAAITPFPAGAIFARVFNAPTIAQSSFYGDAQVFSPGAGAVYVMQVGGTTNAFDSADDDGDGLNNSWEKSLGSNPKNPDSDGDGMLDGDERRAGTNPTDARSNLAMMKITPQAGGMIMATWDAVSGKTYRLEFTTGDLASASTAFSNVSATVTAASAEGAASIAGGLDSPLGFFRVVLVEDGGK